VRWNSSDTIVATVSTSGLITAKTAGTAVITVSTEDGGFTAFCTLTVNWPTGIQELDTKINAYWFAGRLYVHSPVAETIQVYSLQSMLLYSFEKPMGAADYSVDKSNGAILIVKGGSGWVRKIIR